MILPMVVLEGWRQPGDRAAISPRAWVPELSPFSLLSLLAFPCGTSRWAVFLPAIMMALLLGGCREKASDKSESVISAARQAQLRASILASAEQMQKEFAEGNLDAFVSYIYPDVLDKMGGAEKVKNKMAPDFQDIAKSIEKTSMGRDFEVLEDGGRLCAILPVETLYNSHDGKYLQKHYRVACSSDGGKSWTFIDGQGQKPQKEYLQNKFPILMKRIPLPQCGQARMK